MASLPMVQPVFHRASGDVQGPALPEEALPCLGALLQAPRLGLAFLDRELRFRWVNDALMTLSGMTSAAYLGRTASEVWPGLGGLTPLLVQGLGGQAITAARVTGLVGVLAGRGEPRHLRLSVLPATTGGMRMGVGLLVEDETERVREEQALRESEERLRGLAEVACDGHLLHDGAVVLEVSRGLTGLLGYTSEELVGRPLLRWVAPESQELLQQALSRQVEAPFELVGLRADGKRLYWEVLGRLVEHRGRRVWMMAVWDVSARRAAEEASARADSFRDQLLGVVGHDLRTPLYAMQLSLGALQRVGGLVEAHERQVEMAVGAVRRMERMIHELLDYTRARLAGGLPVRPMPFNLDELAKRAVEELQAHCPRRRVALCSEGDMRGMWDEGRLRQLVDNLLSHAVQHSPEDTPLEVRLLGTPEGVTLSVRNEGPPVPLEERALLFEPFRRSKRGAGEGLGLGLYIARQIVLAHGGRVSVESGHGLGTRLIVWLPRHAPGA